MINIKVLECETLDRIHKTCMSSVYSDMINEVKTSRGVLNKNSTKQLKLLLVNNY